ncbi:BTB/POZ domain-containing protein 7 [Lingula anatina]|uniref:BTB/POZ domain-containing protein 7 n=1 Tax=Lingula anatina TaxID=7574 RepID=A0A1S3JUQ8_LINAN|nr:BTB/POZ domain-containing protein 7 [Lingula anatina]XP_013414063.1 BTB/POZ domain-containing protein 7 [Lingula anatina]|eukprot:XP_013414062.1 BTB/POZ domain-containing protein 7 [Lingula anatina]
MGANISAAEKQQQNQSVSRASTLNRYKGFQISEDMPVKEKKKIMSKLATLRRKLIRVRRHSRSFDHSKAIKELTANWTTRELNALVEEYQALAVLKELTIISSLARVHANTYREDLSNLYDYKYCTDVDLIYRGTCFPVHRAILSARCPFFRKLLARHPHYGAQIHVDIKTPNIDVVMFSALLRYLYTGEFNSDEAKLDSSLDLLVQLGDEFGTPNALDHDLKTLFEMGVYGDAVLVFQTDADCHDLTTSVEGASAATSSTGGNKYEMRCHKAILAARSPFFRNLLLRRAKSGEEMTDRTLHTPTRIVLDESIIPKQYARVLLHAIYQDTVDLNCIIRNSTSTCSLSEVQAIVAGKGHVTHVDEAMEIYQIGQFLDFPILSQGCEDIIVDNLSLDNLLSILSWSSEPHGSQWVHRQALHFLQEEFLQAAHSPIFYELNKEYLIAAIQSDFVQAGEMDILSAVIKWGEHQLIRRMEEREPNLLSHTAHSVTKKGVKRRDLNDTELREILCEVLPYVRMGHIIPPNNDVLNGAIKRGLVSVPPSHMIGDDVGSNYNRMCSWIRGKNSGMFMKPRFFTPYFEEAKSLLDEHTAQLQDNEMARLRLVHMSSIPDTLYMVDDRASCPPSPFPIHHPVYAAATVDIIAGTIPVPNRETIGLMVKREQEIQQSRLVQKAYSLPCTDRRAVNHQIQLRVVREFGLPDSAVEILQHPYRFQMDEASRGDALPGTPRISSLPHRRLKQVTPPSPLMGASSWSYSPRSYSPRSYSPVEKEASNGSDSVLSDIMPDIAMATGAVAQMALHPDPEPPQGAHAESSPRGGARGGEAKPDLRENEGSPRGEMKLDLGDGSHCGTMYI